MSLLTRLPAPPRRAALDHDMVDYSRFDGIGDSDEEEEEQEQRPPMQPPMRPPMRPPTNVLDDLEDYFRRMDERSARVAEEQGSEPEMASVDRFDEGLLELLEVFSFSAAAESYSECAICLSDFAEGDECVRLPCAARHVFRASCIKAHLASAFKGRRSPKSHQPPNPQTRKRDERRIRAAACKRAPQALL